MSIIAWIVWIAASLALNCANAINRRALQSKSAVWNAWSSFIVGILYASSIVGIGGELLRAGSRREIASAILTYGVTCVLGSVIGQELVLRLTYFQKIERGRND